MTLKVGSKAPDFKIPDQDGNIVKLADFKGKKTQIMVSKDFQSASGDFLGKKRNKY